MDRSQRGVHHERLKTGSSRATNVLFVTSFCESRIFSVSCDTGTSEVQPLLDLLPRTAHCRFHQLDLFTGPRSLPQIREAFFWATPLL